MICYCCGMARPRVHDLDKLLDAAEKLAADSGAAAVTIRALSETTSVSNGAIYHAFGSRAGLVGHVWLRAAKRFLALQELSVDEALGRGRTSGVDAVIAAADAPARFAAKFPDSARLLRTVRRTELLGNSEMPSDLAEELTSLDGSLTALFIRLSRAVWGRGDRAAVDVIRDCVVELPTALLIRVDRTHDRAARERLAVAVRAVLTLDPPVTNRRISTRQGAS